MVGAVGAQDAQGATGMVDGAAVPAADSVAVVCVVDSAVVPVADSVEADAEEAVVVEEGANPSDQVKTAILIE